MAAVVPQSTLPATPDFCHWPVEHAIVSASVADGVVRLAWSDGRVSRYHLPWLRDMCTCPACMDEVTREQILDLSELPEELAVTGIGVDDAGALCVSWADAGHAGRYHPGWLRANDYCNRHLRVPEPVQVTTWGAEFAARIPGFDGARVLEDDRALRDWLLAIRRYGLTRLRGLAGDVPTLERAAERIGVIRVSNFGRVFHVQARAERDSNAYTPRALLPHTDLPTREVQPGLQLLLCVANSARGGESVMVDGLRLAEQLRREHPAAYEILTTVPVEFSNRSATTEYRWRAPMIGTDADGRVVELRPGALLRAPVDADFERMPAVYAAIRAFVAASRDPSLQAVFPIAPGDLLAFDNRRILHARRAFDATSGERHLVGCYLDADELLSRLRVLARTPGARMCTIRRGGAVGAEPGNRSEPSG